MERWGVIYSPKSGVWHSRRRWEDVLRLLNEHAVEYDFVQSEGRGAEQRLAAMLVQNGYRTIIVVGGDGALNRVVNGIASVDEALLGQVRLGLIPNGYGNDYATFWGVTEASVEEQVEMLVKGRTRKVDVGLLEMDGERRFFMNCVNIGLVSDIFSIRYKANRVRLIAGLSYLWSIIQMLFQRIDCHMRLHVNHEHIDRRLLTVCISNCRGYGQTPNAVPYNGLLDVSTVHAPRVTQLFHGIALLVRGRFLSYRSAQHYRTLDGVDVLDAGGAKVSVDGQVLDADVKTFRVTAVRETINFIIPD